MTFFCSYYLPQVAISLEEENRQLKEARLCKVCMDDDVGVVFLPCGHLGTIYFVHSLSMSMSLFYMVNNSK